MVESNKILLGVGVVLLFDLPAAVTGQSITIPPQNATGKIGGTAQFHCTVKFGTIRTMSWNFNNNPVYIYQYGHADYPKGNKKYRVTKKGNTFRMTVNNLEYNDGGLFTCIIESDMVMDTAVLIVLDMPKIQRSLDTPPERGTVMFICEAWFGGPPISYIAHNHYPDMIISSNKDIHGDVILHLESEQHRKYHQIIGRVLIPLKASMNGIQLNCEIRTHDPMFAVTNTKIPIIDFVDTTVQTTSDNVTEVTENVSYSSESFMEYWKMVAGLAVSVFFVIIVIILAFHFFTRHYKKSNKKQKQVHSDMMEMTGKRKCTESLNKNAIMASNKSESKINLDEEMGAAVEPSDSTKDFGPEYPLLPHNTMARNQPLSENLIEKIFLDSIEDIPDTSINTGATSSSEIIPFKRLDGGDSETDLIRHFYITTELIANSQLRVHIQMLGYAARYGSPPVEGHGIWLKNAVIHFKPYRLFIRSDNNEICQREETEVKNKYNSTRSPENHGVSRIDLPPGQILPAQNIKEISIVLNRVTENFNRFQGETDIYTSELHKAYLAGGIIEAVEKVIDWFYPLKRQI